MSSRKNAQSLQKLTDLLSSPSFHRLAVAFSGGLDSRFLCAAAQRCGCDVFAVHATGPHIPASETQGALEFAQSQGLHVACAPFNPLSIPEVATTDKRRCYACKKALIQTLRAQLRAQGEEDRLLCDGSNADDGSAYRPGIQALREEHVRSPLAEAGITKQTIRELAAEWNLPVPAIGARPCLLTRYAYGLAPDASQLTAIAGAEEALAQLTTPLGTPLLTDFRLRITPQPFIQITQHLSAEDEQRILHIVSQMGFPDCQLLKTKTVSGFFDTLARHAD